jgi:hypothetical protein
MPLKPNRHWGLMTLMTVAAVAMSAATWVDKDWTVKLGQAQWPLVEALMNRSVFEGESLGANDLVILFLLAVAFVYYRGTAPRDRQNGLPAGPNPDLYSFRRWFPQSMSSTASSGLWAVQGPILSSKKGSPSVIGLPMDPTLSPTGSTMALFPAAILPKCLSS